MKKFYECHITVSDFVVPVAFNSSWKRQQFCNYQILINPATETFFRYNVRSEKLYTHKMAEFDSYHQAFEYYTLNINSLSSERFKIEAAIDYIRNYPVYYEAHYKFKGNPLIIFTREGDKEEQKFRKRLSFSENIDKETHWGTFRSNPGDYMNFKNTHVDIMKNYARDIEKFEIESVLIDTNRQLDHEWEIL